MTWRDVQFVAERPQEGWNFLKELGFAVTEVSNASRPHAGGDIHHAAMTHERIPVVFYTHDQYTDHPSAGSGCVTGIEIDVPRYVAYLESIGSTIPQALQTTSGEAIMKSRPDVDTIDGSGTGTLAWTRYEYGYDDLTAFVCLEYVKNALQRITYGRVRGRK